MMENIWGIHEKSNGVQPPFNNVTRLDREPHFNVFFKLQHFQETIYLNCGMRTKVRGLDVLLLPVVASLRCSRRRKPL